MMRRNQIIFIVLIVVCFVVVFLVQYNAPRPFVWRPTFHHTDRQPFGCAVFDDVVATSHPNYHVTNRSLYQCYTDADDSPVLPESRRRSYLIVDEYIYLSDSDIVTLHRMLRQGHHVMLCASSFSDEIDEAFGITTEFTNDDLTKYFNRAVKRGAVRDSIYLGSTRTNAERIYRVYPQLHPAYLESEPGELGSAYSRCVCDNRGRSLAVEVQVDSCPGRLFIVATPLLFTNYGMLDGDNASYIFRLLSLMGRRPLFRLQDEVITVASPGLLSAITDESTLHGALITLLLLIFLLMANAAQRRQRAIPVVAPPANEMLKFTLLIGNLFYQKKNYTGLVQKKYHYFCADLRRLYALNLDATPPDDAAAQLASRMALPTEEVAPYFIELKNVVHDDKPITQAHMRRLIDRINEWKRKLSQ